jgi:threonine dehydrogenase-like Zn-dependent dehydrogenase
MGHEFSGFLESAHTRLPVGTLVTVFPYIPCGVCERCRSGAYHVCKAICIIGIDRDGGMAEYAIAPNDHIFAAPQGTPPALAAFIEPVGISVHVARHCGYTPGDSALVFGAGGIGLACAITLRRFGAKHLMMVEPEPARHELAKSFGFDMLDSGRNITEQVMERTNGDGAQHVYDCAGVQPVIDILPDVVKIGGNIVIVAGYIIPPRMDFQKGMFREFTIKFSRNCTREDFAIACDLIGEGLGYDKLLNYIIPLDDAQSGFAPPKSAFKVLYEAR